MYPHVNLNCNIHIRKKNDMDKISVIVHKIKDNPIIKFINDVTIEELVISSVLMMCWYGKMSKDGLVNISNQLIELYECEKLYEGKITRQAALKNLIWCHETVICCLIKLNSAFLVNESDIECSICAKIARNHIDRLQYQCNQLLIVLNK